MSQNPELSRRLGIAWWSIEVRTVNESVLAAAEGIVYSGSAEFFELPVEVQEAVTSYEARIAKAS